MNTQQSTEGLLSASEEKFRDDLTAIFSKLPGFDDTPVRNFREKRCAHCETVTIWIELEDEREVEITLCPGKPMQLEQVYP